MEKARIQIVEDEAIIAMELESQLQSLGYKVTSIVNTGEKAIQKAESDKPDLILMDIRIKGEMDGIDTAEIIKNKVGIPVVFSTAYLDHGRIERAKIAMPFGYVLKPIQERDLKVTIEMALYVAKLQAERRRAEETYRNTFMNSQVGLFRTDIQTGKILDANNKVAHLIGFQNRDELLAQPFSIAERYVDTADREKMIQLLREQGKFENFEARFRRNDTSIIWMRYSAKLVPEKGWIEGVSEDITTEKKATQALKESENKYRSVIENANEAIIVLQGNEFKYVNPKTCEISGYSEEELYSKTFIDIIHPEDQGMIIDKYARRQRGELLAETYIFRFIGKKENIIWSEIKPVIIDWEGEVATLCFISDITERIQMVENLRKSQAQKQAILDGISINISFVNEKLELLWVN
ncbi:PAS domain S-box protein, partial [bacterium]|nr:PAS domain S-box protein [bacterium]